MLQWFTPIPSVVVEVYSQLYINAAFNYALSYHQCSVNRFPAEQHRPYIRGYQQNTTQNSCGSFQQNAWLMESWFLYIVSSFSIIVSMW